MTRIGTLDRDDNERSATAIQARQKAGTLPIPKAGEELADETRRGLYLDWEPLETLLETIEMSGARSVGGTLQVARVYQYGETEQFVWEDESGTQSFGGRPTLATERADRRVMRRMEGDSFGVEIRFSESSVSFGNADRSTQGGDR